MEKYPVPAPRARLTKQAEVYSDDMTIPNMNISVNQDKKPPPVPPKTIKILKIGGQPLPGMMRACSLPESNQQSGKGEYTVQRTSQNLVESKVGAQERRTTHGVLMSQHTWHGDFQQPLADQPTYERTLEFLIPSFSQCHQESQDSIDIMEWWNSEEPWKKLESSGTEKLDEKSFTQKTENLKRAFYVYNHLLSEEGANLQGHIIELEEVANGIDKVHKGVKIARITGGTAGAVGVAAAVGGVILAPLTMGASLAVTAVGVGVAAAGGVTGASAAITNKVHTNMDRKKVETILKEHSNQMEEIERCVKFIGTHIESLKKYNLSTLRGVDWKSVKVARMAHTVGDSVGAIGAVSKSSGMIQGLALGLDMYFSKEDSKQLKKGSETKFAKQIREVAKQMQASLDEVMKLKTKVESEAL